MKPSILCLLLALPAIAQETKTAPAVAGPWSKTATLPAEALPFYRVHLGTPATGWIATVSADVGTRVKAGDLLAEIRALELVAARDARAEEARAAKQKIAAAASMLKSCPSISTTSPVEFNLLGVPTLTFQP